jgi:starch phosphorylase
LPQGFDLRKLPEQIIFQLNDTHPVIAIPELMRLLVDENGLEWDEAWAITQKCFAYTCHTLLPEALEVWPTDLLGRLLPRHLEIIYRINEEFLASVRAAYPGDEMRARRMSIISDYPQAVRMAHLRPSRRSASTASPSCTPSCCVTRCCRTSRRSGRRSSPTSPTASPRVASSELANPALSQVITDAIGEGWVTDLERLRELEPYADDPAFRAEFRRAKAANKKRLYTLAEAFEGVSLPEGHLIDVMVKRLHEYKRQLLKVLHVVSTYEGILSGAVRAEDITPRLVVFGAKAAPGYFMAKEIIYLINRMATVINNDPLVKRQLIVGFPANYNVTLAEKIIPAADLSEQISLAGKEASGTGNMKFTLNGALTIGTDDGANVEIRAPRRR